MTVEDPVPLGIMERYDGEIVTVKSVDPEATVMVRFAVWVREVLVPVT